MNTFGTLYLVGTPIGNLSDLSQRAVSVLQEADLIACEDTRTSGSMLRNAGIETRLTSYHQHNEHRKTDSLIEHLKSGMDVALISDAGMPAISDPGFLIVRESHKNGITVVPVPGPSAVICAVAASGLPSDRFIFEGFPPQKKGRKTRLAEIAEEDRTVVLYESPHRLVKLLGELLDVCGEDRLCCVAREITKKFEEIRRGTLKELHQEFSSRERIKGEFAIVLSGKSYQETTTDD